VDQALSDADTGDSVVWVRWTKSIVEQEKEAKLLSQTPNLVAWLREEYESFGKHIEVST